MITSVVQKLLDLEELQSHRDISGGILSTIEGLRKRYENFEQVPFVNTDSQHAYWAFWWPRQVEIFQEFFRLAGRPLKFPVWDYGCGGVPGLALHPHDQWFVWDKDLSLAKVIHRHFSREIQILPPTDISRKKPATVLMMMSYGEIKPKNALIQEWLAQGIDVVIIEPGTMEHSQSIQRLRDHFSSSVIFPCPSGVTECPLRKFPQDWCHARREWSPPEWYSQIAQKLKVDVRFLKFSGVWLSSNPGKSGEDIHRVVDIPRRVGSKSAGIWEWRSCSSDGLGFQREQGLTAPWPWDNK